MYQLSEKRVVQLLTRSAHTRNDTIHTVPGAKVHRDCRKKYCNPHQVAKDTKGENSEPGTSSERYVLRSSEEGFSFKNDCFFCGKLAKFGSKVDTASLVINSICCMQVMYMQNACLYGVGPTIRSFIACCQDSVLQSNSFDLKNILSLPLSSKLSEVCHKKSNHS